MKGTTQRALTMPVYFSVIQVRSSLFTRVPPERLFVSVKLRWSFQSSPPVWRTSHSHDWTFGRVAINPAATLPPSLLVKPRSTDS